MDKEEDRPHFMALYPAEVASLCKSHPLRLHSQISRDPNFDLATLRELVTIAGSSVVIQEISSPHLEVSTPRRREGSRKKGETLVFFRKWKKKTVRGGGGKRSEVPPTGPWRFLLVSVY